MSNTNSSHKTIASGGNGHSDTMNRQPPSRRPITRSTAGSTNASMPSPSNQSDANASSSSQFQGFNIDLTNLDDSVDTKSNIGIMTNSPYLVGNTFGQPIAGGVVSKREPNPFSILDAVPKFDSEAPDPSRFNVTYGMSISNSYQAFDMTPVPRFDSQVPEPVSATTGMDPYQIQYFAQASTPAPPTTSAPTSRFSRGVTEVSNAEIDHVAPNRITEAGPIPHPDQDWRPYGTNHWHVFLATPDTLKYLSTSEIKEIREHCYQLSKAVDANGDATNAVLLIPNTTYTTADAQTVWKHCDSYIRRRGQLRNNNAARRSRQRKDAETKYWRKKALEYGCPDHEFVWDGREVTPNAATNAYASTPAGPQTRARARQGRAARGRGQRRGNTAAREGSVAAPGGAPDLDQPNWP